MPIWHRLLVLLCDDSDGISNGAHGIVTIVIANSRQVQRAFFARPLHQITDIVFEIEKDTAAQELRSREKAEVFTPSWVCNVQNNLVDDAWFGISRRRFNTEKQDGWKTNYYPISFAEAKGKT